ncbi:TPR repeat-containing protein (plasmid) [Nostoc sp. HK-01]|nr:TPR repeat-containing protein [Nostoc sp. HK-01]
MRDRKISLTALITLILTILQPIANLPPLFQASQVLAQTPVDRKAEAYQLLQQGNEQLNNGNFEAALQPLQQALLIYRELKEPTGEGAALFLLGSAYEGLGEYSKAIEYYQQSLVIAREINNPKLEAQTQQQIAQAQAKNNPRKKEADQLLKQSLEQVQANQFESALKSFEQPLKIYQEIKDRRGEGYTLRGLGLTYLGLRNQPKAIEYFQQSLSISREINDPELEALMQKYLTQLQVKNNPQTTTAQIVEQKNQESLRLFEIGRQQLNQSQFNEALTTFQKVLVIVRTIKIPEGEAHTLNSIGLVYSKIGDYKKALDYCQKALAIDRQLNKKDWEASTLNNIGTIHNDLGNYDKALDFYQQALKIRQAIGNEEIAINLNNIGQVYIYQGKYELALESFQQALVIVKKNQDKQGEEIIINNIAQLYDNKGQYPQALELYQQALTITKDIGNKEEETRVLNNIGVIYVNLGQSDASVTFLQQALAIAQKIGDQKQEGTTLNNIGQVYHLSESYNKALDYYQQALLIFQKIGGQLGQSTTLNNIGGVYQLQGEYTIALDFFQKSLAITKEIDYKYGEGRILNNIAQIYHKQGQYSQALSFYNQALDINIEVGDQVQQGGTLHNLGSLYKNQGQYAQAEKTLFAAIQVWESLRPGLKDEQKISIFEKQADTYLFLQSSLVAQNKINSALEIAERGRTRAFVELLASKLFSNPKEKFQFSTSPTITSIKQTAKSQNSTLVEYSIIYDEFKIQGKQEVKESELYIWVIKPTGEVTFRKADLKPLWQKENTTLEKLVNTSRNSIGAISTPFRGGIIPRENPDKPKAKQKFQQLHKLLIEPIADLLPKQETEKVIFIAQGALFLVPFPALQDVNGKYLIEKHTILTSPSIQVLDLTHKQRQRTGTQRIQGKDTLIIGNPVMPFAAPKIGETPQQLIPLPGAEQEAIAISKLLKTEPLIGNKATEATVVQRLPQARFVHLATHGLFDDIQGLNSGIALTPSGKDNGLLTASEILDLKLNAELVVLSACDTGRGRISGDGVIGLSRSLISAGVPSVLVSLWSVPDAPTALLMTEFYQNLQKGSDKAQALRQAMLTTMKNNPNPVDWAAFTLIGEAE